MEALMLTAEWLFPVPFIPSVWWNKVRLVILNFFSYKIAQVFVISKYKIDTSDFDLIFFRAKNLDRSRP